MPTRLTTILVSLLASSSSAQITSPQWFATHDGPASAADGAVAVAVDAAGNVYTVGSVAWSPQASLYVPKISLCKYTPSGQLAWSREWGTGYYSGNGYPSHVALAPNGNVIVAGSRDLGEDWVVLAYAPDGGLLFERLWLADSWFVSSPEDLAIDAASNVYLCGDIGDQASFESRAALVKVDASGALAWTRVYDGTGNSIATASSLALATDGSLYLTGGASGPNAALEFCVAKVDPFGAPLWRRNHWTLDFNAYNGGCDIAIAAGGGIVATGTINSNSGQGSGISTIAYDASGTQLWRCDYDPVFNQSEGATALVMDSSGNAYVAGYRDPAGAAFDALLLKITAGQLMWMRSFAGAVYDIDLATSADHVFVATEIPGTDAPVAIREYDLQGALVRDFVWAGPSGSSSTYAAFALAPGAGPVIVGRSYGGAATGDDVLTSAFDPYGRRTYCTAKLSSAGCSPAIGWSGIPSISSSAPFTIHASAILNQRSGLFLYSTFGSAASPFGGGTLCVAQPVRRTPVQLSGGSSAGNDCSGTYDFDFNAWLDAHVDPSLNPGSFVDGQYWYRDPASNGLIGLSNGIEFRIEP